MLLRWHRASKRRLIISIEIPPLVASDCCFSEPYFFADLKMKCGVSFLLVTVGVGLAV